MDRFSQNTLGAIYMMLAMAGYVVNDTFMKLVLTNVNLFQAMFLRGIFNCILLALLCYFMGGFKLPLGLKASLSHKVMVWRTFAEAAATFFFLSALSHMPIANITAVLQILPLTITLGAALFFGESVGWRRYGAIIIGFLGVLLIIRPGTDGFNFFSFYALGATFFVTLRDLITRKLPRTIPSLFASFITAITIMTMGLIGSQFQPWDAVNTEQWFFLFSAAAILVVGYIFSILAMREGDVSFVAPFRYSILILALLIGYFVFSEIPDTWALIGSCIVVGSGCFTFYRENISRNKNKKT